LTKVNIRAAFACRAAPRAYTEIREALPRRQWGRGSGRVPNANRKEDIMSNLTRYDPLDDLFRGFFVKPMDLPAGASALAALAPQQIKMDVKEQKEAYLVHAEMPGVRKEDIHVTVEGNQVSISAEVKHEKEVKEGERVLRSERYFGQVSRSFQLGHEVDDARASAKFADGVLELTLPKKAGAQGKRLSIT
jgi:HSP20 family protein